MALRILSIVFLIAAAAIPLYVIATSLSVGNWTLGSWEGNIKAMCLVIALLVVAAILRAVQDALGLLEEIATQGRSASRE